MKSWRAALGGVALCLASCSGFTDYDECRSGETEPCEAQCGPGTRTCEGGAWGACLVTETPECEPGESGLCELEPGAPPGLWFCSDTCTVGPCIEMCTPGYSVECEALCGQGQATCQNDGSWGECLEYIIPDCHPGDVELCHGEDGVGYRRCSDTGCEWGPCEVSMDCLPGEVALCAACATQACGEDNTWGECIANPGALCIPGESQGCPGPCGTGFQICSSDCVWSECQGFGACIPGERQLCPSSYCGFAYRVCGPSCNWTDCVEAGF